MRTCTLGLIGLLCHGAAHAASIADMPSGLHLNYEMYAAGLQVADLETGFSITPQTYQMNLAYHTTGMVGLFFHAHQITSVNGNWLGARPAPVRFFGEGTLRGEQRLTDINYAMGRPTIRQLVPPNVNEREPVPEAMQTDSIDTLSALVDLIRTVATTGRCELSVHTFDGRRAIEIEAHTVGEETLTPLRRSAFNGQALRCDFTGRLLAGFKIGDNRERDSRPLHGSAWLAPVMAGAPSVPVRMQFETRWFGDATMYLTAAARGANLLVAHQ